MNRDDITRMAREAGFVANVSEEPYAKLCHPTPTSTALFKMLERFAALVAAAKQEQCAQIAERLGADFAVIEAIRNA